MRLTDTAAEPRGGVPAAPTTGTAGPSRRAGRPPLSRLEVWIPTVYATASAIWIACSDLLISRLPLSVREHVLLSIAKGFGFIAFTTGLLYAGLRWASERERETLRRVAASEALLRAVVDAIPDPVFVKDRTGRWLYANPATGNAVGKGAAETLGRTDREIYDDAEVGEVLFATDQRILASGVAETIEEVIQTRDGYRVFQSAKAPVRDAEGRVIGIVGAARDITEHRRAEEADSERRRAEEALGERERYLETVLQTALDGFYAVDPRMRLVEVNDAYCGMIGFSRDELLTMSIADLEVAEAAEAVSAHAQRIRTLGADRFETRHRRKDGRIIDVECSVKFLPDGGGVIVCFIRDITVEKRARELLQHSEERFRALIEKATDILVLLDAEGRIVFWSPGASQALGWTQDEVLTLFGPDLVHPDDQPAWEDAFDEMAARPGETVRLVTRQKHQDGSWRLVEVAGRNLLHDSVVSCVVANMRDITEQRRLEEQFHQAQKLESVGRLAGGVAHDFNNLLTVILSCSEAVRHALASGTVPDREDVEEIHGAGERARDLTRQLLAFARKQVIAPTPLDLNAVVRGSEKMLRRVALGEAIELDLRLEPELWTALCDLGQMEQVILNLAVNARDAMPAGGTLTIATSNLAVEGDPLLAAFPGLAPGDYVQLAVRDSGVGMTAEVQERIFEPFFTTKEMGKGTGLGLSTVYGIVKQSNGFIRVESKPGCGTTFLVCFPRVARPEEPRRATTGLARSRGTETVLLVEDDPAIRALAARALSAGGYDVLVAAGGTDASAVARGAGRAPDLLVTDVVMPGRDGRAVAEELVGTFPGLRVLYVSGYTRDVIAEHGLLDSGIHFLQKPFTPTTLLERVRAVLDDR